MITIDDFDIVSGTIDGSDFMEVTIDGEIVWKLDSETPSPIGNPIHWWPIDDNDGSTVYDHIGSQDLTVDGASFISNYSEVGGRRLSFDSDNEELVHGNVSTSSDQITIICTAEATQDISNGGLVSMAASGSADKRLGLRLDENALLIRMGNIGINRTLWGYDPIGNRHRFAITSDSNTHETVVYINGTEFFTRSDPDENFDWSDPWFSIGSMRRHWGDDREFFDGFISDVVVYDHVLSSSNIQNDYQRSMV